MISLVLLFRKPGVTNMLGDVEQALIETLTPGVHVIGGSVHSLMEHLQLYLQF
jgi:hypothetical protein